MTATDHLWPSIIRRLPHLLLFLIVAVAYWSGALEFLDQKLTDVRFQILTREASQDVLLVEIDAPSLQELSVWPWPRSYHAEIVRNLWAAGAEHIVIDIDFSSHSDPREDNALVQVLASSQRRVVLPVFMQNARSRGGGVEEVLAAPFPELLEHVDLASVNLRPDSDGLIRQVAFSEPWGYGSMPTLFSVLVKRTSQDAGPFYIDYGIKPQTFMRVSYADILLGRFDPSRIAGKTILIGSTALELGDTLSVPVYRTLPGAMIQLLAQESVAQGRALQRLPRALILLVAFVVLVVLGPCLIETAWGRGLAMVGSFVLFVLLFSLGLQAMLPIIMDVAPLLLAGLFSYGAMLVCRINRQDFRLMAQSLVIRRRDAFMRKVLDNSSDGILVLDQNQVIRECNRAAERMLDVPVGLSGGQSLKQVAAKIQPSDAGVQFAKILQLRGGPHDLTLGKVPDSKIFLQVTVSDTVVDSEHSVIVLLRDVTEENWAKAQAERARLHLEDAVESIHEGFALYDGSDRLVLSNSKFRGLLFGDPAVSGLGMTFEAVMLHSAQTGRVKAAQENLGEWLEERVAAHRRQDGHYEEVIDGGVYLQVSERGTIDNGTVAIYHDVSDLKDRELELNEAVERESFANRCKTEFLANMSHELRTPLNAIIGFSELMAGEILGPLGNAEYKNYSNDVLNSGRHLLELINEILDVSKIEAGKYELNETEVDTAAIIQSCLKMLTVRIKAAELELKAEVPEDLPTLHASPRALKQVILNLLSNAIKFTQAKGSLFVEAELAEEGQLIIRIIDTGIGMAEEYIPNAFALFGQVDSKLARKYEGTGLGLPLARKLMELHDGELLLESEVDVGTAVTLTFPKDRVQTHLGPAVVAKSA